MSRRNSIPILYTSGTYYQVGYDVGRTFRSLIEDFLLSIQNQHKSLLQLFSSGKGKDSYDVTLKNLKENLPHYVRELQGVADGARVPFDHLMVLHLIPRRQPGAQDLASNTSPVDTGTLSLGCSSVSLNLEEEILLGHTEDAQGELLNHLYIVDAHITEDEPQGKLGIRSEKFTALCYAGHLPGFCMGFNHHGLVFSVNVITPLNVHSGKTPRHLLCRAMLAAEDMPSLHRILKDEGVGAEDGFGINASFMDKNGAHLFHNIEVGPVLCGEKQSQMSVFTLATGDHLLHTNKYLHLQIAEHETLVWRSSEARHARAKEVPPPVSREDLINLLSDECHPEHPFFRDDDPLFITTAVGLFDIGRKTWTLWMKNPKRTDPLCVLPISFKWDY